MSMHSRHHVENRLGGFITETMGCQTLSGLVRIRDLSIDFASSHPDDEELVEMARRVHMMTIIRLGKLLIERTDWAKGSAAAGFSIGLAVVARRVARADVAVRRRLLDDPHVLPVPSAIRRVLNAHA